MGINDSLKENFELRIIARQKLKGKWLYAVLVCFVANIITFFEILNDLNNENKLLHLTFFVIIFIISGALALGLAKFFLNLRRDQNPQFSDLLDGFKSFSLAWGVQIRIWIITGLWTLLFIIPGIVAALRYALSFYILQDHPEMKPREALDLSKQMMMGRKGKLFKLYLSFIGWALLSFCTAGIGLLWLIPYIHASEASFYEDLKDAPLANDTSTATTTT
jgi:Predicted integral membrane protein